MKTKQVVIVQPKERTAYQIHRDNGGSPYDYLKMTLVIMAGISALVMLGSKFDKIMHDPLWGMIGTGLIILVAIKLFQGFDKNYG